MSFLKQRVFDNLLLDTEVFMVLLANHWKHGVETNSKCGGSMNTNVLLPHLFLKMFSQFMLLSRQFRPGVSRTGCGVRLPGLSP